ncbi:chromosome segregation protein SMC [Geobacillus sp. 46C-IIa]|uniref:AAA family ATPase n=1 Tax=Geobacillus sp. 46C-IIa TaxID=1963025 RepID=UPI0009C0323B|nr:SMC family ATPase [Geobacillus sp. 46C-IIa]OQP06955.1 chromosome segregation protein SMC [Geobacillus sp. 46C-IIa]QNU27324.1 SMC family ATPase [Geobacillus sp. 46C-IIa]
MKPISLTIAGLHSFREKQTIDFTTLCDGGVFGIFGPTGSGKSTILDAITLALYGSVERAANRTQAIINHAEQELFVSFTFELEHAAGAKRYTVERSLKKVDEWRARSAVCRLIEHQPEPVVLADKLSDVDKAVGQLLGLTMEDFTRAVVLPQGKFAEFLSLKGAERRQMLQRLFHLERYGDQLSKKLKDRLAAAEQEEEKIKAEKAGLGDASKAALEQAEAEERELAALLAKRKKELEDVEADVERTRQLWVWQQEKEAVERELAELRRREPEIRALEEKKERAEQAERIWPYREQYEQARRLRAEASKRYEELARKLEEAKAGYEEAVRRYEQARQEKASREPELLAQTERLRQAEQLERQMEALTHELAALNEERNRLAGREKAAQRRFEEASAWYERGMKRQQELKEELQRYAEALAGKDEVEQAHGEKRQIEQAAAAIARVDAQLRQKEAMWRQAEEERAKRERQAAAVGARLQQLFRLVEKTYHSVCQRQQDVEKRLYALQQDMEVERKRMEEARTAELAAVLAEQLRPGEPCPVCGSREHPHPSTMPHSSGYGQLPDLEQKRRQCEQDLQVLFSLKAQLEQLAGLAAGHGAPPFFAAGRPSEEVDDVAVEVRALEQDVIEQKESVYRALAQWNEAETARREAENACRWAAADREALQAERQRLEEERQQLEQQWRHAYPSFSLETIDAVYEQLREQEKRWRDVQKRLEDSVPFLEEKQRAKEEASEEQRRMETERIRLDSLINAKQQLSEEYARQRREKAGPSPAAVQLREAEAEWRRLQSGEQQAYDEWQRAQKQHQTLESETKAAKQAYEEGVRREEEALARWRRALADTAFADAEEAERARATKEQCGEWDEAIRRYWRQVEQAEHRRAQLAAALGEAVVSAEQWEMLQRVYAERKVQMETMTQQLGAIQAKVAELRKKHARFVELEAKQAQLSRQIERYKQLQTLLRGNSFVEFMAEEQLEQVTAIAAERLQRLTRHRYSLELDSQGGFLIRDDANGGVRRPVATLSGGETFLTSLSLALALSAQIQLRGEYPLRFFFLDEGFGTLDAELLDMVISALEKLHTQRLAVGVISHVQEIRTRLPRRLIVEPAEPSGRGTRVRLETM